MADIPMPGSAVGATAGRGEYPIKRIIFASSLGTMIEYANGDELLCADQTQDVVAMVRAAWLPVADWLAKQ